MPCSLGLVEYAKKQNKPMAKHLKKSGAEGVQFLREFRLGQGTGDLKQGDRVLAEEFKPKDVVDVIGTSKGRGFAGRGEAPSFSRRSEPRTVRCFTARRVRSALRAFRRACFPGMKMGGRMGTDQVTVRNLEIVSVDTEDNVIAVKGAIPGTEWRLRDGAPGEAIRAGEGSRIRRCRV